MRDKMTRGEPYQSVTPELDADRQHAWRVMDRFNATAPDDGEGRFELLQGLLAHVGEGVVLFPGLRIFYGYNTRIGARSFINYDGLILDSAPVTIGEDVAIGPRVQLLTALHPVEDHDARVAGWETTAPITIGDRVWFGGGVIVLPGVTIGPNTVVGAGSVVTRDLPEHVFAAGNPARMIRQV